jgi:hypothetical protein
MDEVTGLHQLSVALMPLEPVARTQKVLAGEASPRNPPRSSLDRPHFRISEIAYATAGLSVSQPFPRVFLFSGSTGKLREGMVSIPHCNGRKNCAIKLGRRIYV